MRKRVITILDLIIDGIETMQDYILARQITLSEGFLFGVTASLRVTLVFVDIPNVPPPASAILVLSLAHFASFFFNSKVLRVVISAIYAFFWCVTAFLIAYAHLVTPLLIISIWFVILAFILTMRLYRDYRTDA